MTSFVRRISQAWGVDDARSASSETPRRPTREGHNSTVSSSTSRPTNHVLRNQSPQRQHRQGRGSDNKPEDVQQLHRRIDQLEAAMQKREVQIRSLQRDKATLEAFVQMRNAELKEAHSFLESRGDIADSDVLRSLGRLNSMIFQTAASAAESSLFRFHARPTRNTEGAVRRLDQDGWLATPLLQALQSVDHAKDPILLQTAMAGVLTGFAHNLATLWAPHGRSSHTLSELYSQVRERGAYIAAVRRQHVLTELLPSEPQAVAGRWRAISLAAAQGLTRVEGAASHRSSIVAVLVDVLLASGVSESKTLDETVKTHFGAQLEEMADLAKELRLITGVIIISRDLTTLTTEIGIPFDSRSMTDEWANVKNDSPSPSGNVLCSTQLGMKREDSLAHSITLMKPKVALDSLLLQFQNQPVT